MPRLPLWPIPVAVVLVSTIGYSASVPASPSVRASVGTPTPCPVTQPNGNQPPGSGSKGGYGNDELWTNVWMWSENGTVPIDATHVLPDGEFGDLKWAWYRYVPGTLTIDGHRLDAPAEPLRAWIPDGYGDIGFQVSGLIFPTGGCWEVTGRVGEASLAFVTLVIPPDFPITPTGWCAFWRSPFSDIDAVQAGLHMPATPTSDSAPQGW